MLSPVARSSSIAALKMQSGSCCTTGVIFGSTISRSVGIFPLSVACLAVCVATEFRIRAGYEFTPAILAYSLDFLFEKPHALSLLYYYRVQLLAVHLHRFEQ
jgi:hypothetical protein